MSAEILDEYVDICIAIRNMWEAIGEYKKSVQYNLESCSTDIEKKEIENDFKKKISLISSNSLITTKYKSLKKRKVELRKLLLPKDSTQIDKCLTNLKIKYSKNINKRIVIIDDKQFMIKRKIIKNNKMSSQCNQLLTMIHDKLDIAENIRSVKVKNNPN